MRRRLIRLVRSFSSSPGYTLMRGLARFSLLRVMVPRLHGWIYARKLKIFEDTQSIYSEKSVISGIDVDQAVSDLRTDGVAFGFRLPKEVVDEIVKYAKTSVCYADRNPNNGFKVTERAEAEEKLSKKILVAQYFNTTSECPIIASLAHDPILNRIAHQYLQSVPTFVGANLWWTFPVSVSREEQSRHAHLFHRDVDDFRFFKFFFYLTDVEKGDGAHVCVLGSQANPPTQHFIDKWNIRRYTDEEVTSHYAPNQIKEICGKAGDGFAEDTWCLHKGMTPTRNPRLLLQLQFALFDYGAMNDNRDPSVLKNLQ